jgi:hypothetical protein
MADDRLAREREHDKEILIAIVKDIGEQLEIIVFKRKDLFRKEFRHLFPGPWDDVKERIAKAIHALEHDNFNWEYVEGAGLVRDSLQFKRNMLTAAIGEGVVGRILKVINSILGSLSGALPILEGVKEYKEHVEAAVAIQNRWQ